MKIGFSTLALFMDSFENFLERASTDGFDLMEILCEGPYWPRNVMLMDTEELAVFTSYDIEVFLHSPTIDLNPASLNPGIRKETLRQLEETIDLAVKIGAEAVTTHPGMIHRLEERVRDLGREYAIETLQSASDHANNRGIKFSIENMPGRYAYFCNNFQEHQTFTETCECYATLDVGHANTSKNTDSFFKMDNILYYHVSDNNGEKDQHLSLGEGNLNLNLLKGLENVIIELNDYNNILKSREVLINLNQN
ncbi:MAG: xylose isomerase [Methanobacterium sp. BRmetb2]|jgi:sugar phosphate isomerase/epimerase|nr:MAG: xylose isomerase [Methanobacterium sp. BRmetb2]